MTSVSPSSPPAPALRRAPAVAANRPSRSPGRPPRAVPESKYRRRSVRKAPTANEPASRAKPLSAMRAASSARSADVALGTMPSTISAAPGGLTIGKRLATTSNTVWMSSWAHAAVMACSPRRSRRTQSPTVASAWRRSVGKRVAWLDDQAGIARRISRTAGKRAAWDYPGNEFVIGRRAGGRRLNRPTKFAAPIASAPSDIAFHRRRVRAFVTDERCV